ncbi:alpha/beta-hydrolase [Basidiobolus meristosporus CBS 931.73]|uniref:Alpha/beta-hydrolase n=1 Tax=Basidiobolus meristosporus CBS 931.73 TaxID=1314790 RepID=A0A1Y1Z8I4_9FUNG|nr:alpha/beta-hydrolase [Basidiobolus meristosporus CBS 931.73]|eukprot:ORY06580.1 alpha/beta-hydrolase [Basidiobolus meristosporus CBS 931.73]
MILSLCCLLLIVPSLCLNVVASLSSLSPSSFNHRYDTINGIKYHYVDEGPKDGPVVVLLHGFPDLWYGWRHQIKFLADRGYRVICPDLRGYGETDSPHCPPNDIRMYTTKNVSNDIVEILDKNSIDKVVVIGHDWGGHLAWRVALHHPERLLGVGSLCTPYVVPTGQAKSLEEVAKGNSRFAYQLEFIKPETEKYFDENAELVLRSFFYRNRPEDDVIGFLQLVNLIPKFLPLPQPKPANFVSEPEIRYYIDQYNKRGFHGALNWYRNIRANWENEVSLPKNITIPSLMVTVGHDPVLHPSAADGMEEYISNLTRRHIEDSAHWVLVEQPHLSNKHISEFLESLPLDK